MANHCSYRYRIVDVFTQVPFEGNALAVFPESNELDDQTMQRIAREMNLSETVFIRPATKAGCAAELRIFTPMREMAFAGHPTVGASFVLRDEGIVPGSTEHFFLQAKIGAVPIRIELGEDIRIWLSTPAIQFGKFQDRSMCARLLGLKPDDLMMTEPQFVDAGNPTLLIAVKGKAEVDRSWVDATALEDVKAANKDPFCIFVFTPTSDGAYSRMFAPDYGIVEDPATGSSTGPLAAFMVRNRLLQRPDQQRFVSEQGTKMGRRSLLYFEVSPSGSDSGILVGGHVKPVAMGLMQF